MNQSDELMLAQIRRVQERATDPAAGVREIDRIIRLHRGNSFQEECAEQAKRELVAEATETFGAAAGEQLARRFGIPWPMDPQPAL